MHPFPVTCAFAIRINSSQMQTSSIPVQRICIREPPYANFDNIQLHVSSAGRSYRRALLDTRLTGASTDHLTKATQHGIRRRAYYQSAMSRIPRARRSSAAWICCCVQMA